MHVFHVALYVRINCIQIASQLTNWSTLHVVVGTWRCSFFQLFLKARWILWVLAPSSYLVQKTLSALMQINYNVWQNSNCENAMRDFLCFRLTILSFVCTTVVVALLCKCKPLVCVLLIVSDVAFPTFASHDFTEPGTPAFLEGGCLSFFYSYVNFCL